MGCEVRVHVFIWYILRPEEVKIADLVPKGAAVALGTEAQAESFQQTPVLYVCAAIGMLRLFLHDLPTAFSQISYSRFQGKDSATLTTPFYMPFPA